MENENISRLERYLQAIAEGTGTEQLPVPQSRLEEIFLAIATGDDSHCPQPQSRLEAYALACVGAGGGTATPTQDKSIVITENGTTEVFPDEGYALGKVTATAQVYDGGVDPRFKQLVDRTITEYYDSDITEIHTNVFYNCKALKNVNLPNATKIHDGAFYNCVALSSVSAPNLVDVAVTSSAGKSFNSCAALTSVDFPLLEKLGNGIFASCYSLTSVNLPKLRSMGGGVFAACSKLPTIDLPNLETISYVGGSGNTGAFENCYALTTINLPNLKTIENRAFYNCKALTNIVLPKVLRVTNYMCSTCANLHTVDLPQATEINNHAFSNCGSLSTIVLRTPDQICKLSGTATFTNTPFVSTGTGGIILVPRELILLYQNATNWSTLYAGGKCLFWAIEDYTLQGDNAGEIAWDYLEADRKAAFGIA